MADPEQYLTYSNLAAARYAMPTNYNRTENWRTEAPDWLARREPT